VTHSCKFAIQTYR